MAGVVGASVIVIVASVIVASVSVAPWPRGATCQ